MILHDGGSEVDVFEVQHEGGGTSRVDEQWVGEVDIGFCLKEGGEALAEALGSVLELDHEDIAGAEGDAAFHEEGFNGIGIADNEPGYGDIDGVLEAKAEDHDVGVLEEPDHAEKGTGAVDEKDGELADGGAVGVGFGFHGAVVWEGLEERNHVLPSAARRRDDAAVHDFVEDFDRGGEAFLAFCFLRSLWIPESAEGVEVFADGAAGFHFRVGEWRGTEAQGRDPFWFSEGFRGEVGVVAAELDGDDPCADPLSDG